MKTGRRLFMTFFIIVGGLLVSGPMLFLIYGALGAALSGVLVLIAGALLPLPIMLGLKKMGWLPETDHSVYTTVRSSHNKEAD